MHDALSPLLALPFFSSALAASSHRVKYFLRLKEKLYNFPNFHLYENNKQRSSRNISAHYGMMMLRRLLRSRIFRRTGGGENFARTSLPLWFAEINENICFVLIILVSHSPRQLRSLYERVGRGWRIKNAFAACMLIWAWKSLFSMRFVIKTEGKADSESTWLN